MTQYCRYCCYLCAGNEKGYRPRSGAPKKKQCDGQMELFGEDSGYGR